MDMMDHNHTSGMMMTFHFSHSIPMGLLFSSWTIESVGDMAGAVIVWFILSILYEGLKTLREYLIYVDMKHWKKYNHGSSNRMCRTSTNLKYDKTALIVSEDCNMPVNNKGIKYYTVSISMHLIQSALHVIQVGYGYLLMLVVMTFNGWLFLAVIFGAGVGYLLFAKSRHLMGNFREQNEHCH